MRVRYRNGFAKLTFNTWKVWSDYDDYLDKIDPELVMPAIHKDKVEAQDLIDAVQEGDYDYV